MANLGPVIFLTAIFLLNFLSRIILAPLLPTIESDLGITHAEAGSLFMSISIGYSTALLGSGFISSRISHRKTIILSSVISGITLIGIAFSQSLFQIHAGLILLGMAAGIYLPSGMATLTDLVPYKHWGKAIAIHELAPSLAFMIAPFISEIFLTCCPWKGVLIIIGCASISIAAAYALFGRGGSKTGGVPNYTNIRRLLKHPAFWVMALLFSLGIAASIGVYSMLPLYLVAERGAERSLANALIGLSRIPVLFMALLAGWISDRIGPNVTIKCVLIFNGIMTILLGSVTGNLVFVTVFFQPMLSVCFFPAAFTILANIDPPELRNLSVSITIFFAYLIGAGLIPAGMGTLGEFKTFSLAIIMVGFFILASVFLTRYLDRTQQKTSEI